MSIQCSCQKAYIRCHPVESARKPIFVAILLNLPRKRRAMMEDVNVSNVMREVGRMLESRLTLAVIVKDRHAQFVSEGEPWQSRR
jgi:hypothetical protein